MRANLLAYARWHAKDQSVRALTPVALFLLLFSFPVIAIASKEGFASVRAGGAMNSGAMMVYRNTMTLAMTLGALVFASGFVALDRMRGHVRFHFAAPVVPWEFYLQRFVIGLGTFVLGFSLIPLGFSAVIAPVATGPVLASALLYGTLLGSLALLAGSITDRDGMLIIGITVMASATQTIPPEIDAPAFIKLLAAVLPPVGTADSLRTALLGGEPLVARKVFHVLAYSAGMLAAALFVIRKRDLVR